MNILQVIPYFIPAWSYGGPVQAAYNLSKYLVKKGHYVTVYTSDTLDDKNRVAEKEEIIDGIRVKRFRNINKSIAYKHRLFFTPTIFSEAKKNLKCFDIVHLHEYRTVQNLAIHHYARKYNIPYLIQAHGSTARVMAKKKLKQIFDYLQGYKLLRDAHAVIALNKREIEQYINMGVDESKIEIIPLGIDLQEYSKLPVRGEFKRKYGLGDDQRLILYLGRINKIKGLELLAKAFAILASDLDDITLAIVGPDDGYLTSLKKLIDELEISDKVIITGPLYGDDKLKAYADADVYALPSIYETFPVTLLEAWACEVPVVVSDTCGIVDLVRDRIGLVTPQDTEKLSKALKEILDNNLLYKNRFTKLKKELEELKWETIGHRIEAIYKKIINVNES